jgi:hypothetical protein
MQRVDKTINSNNNGGRNVFHVFLASHALTTRVSTKNTLQLPFFETLNYGVFSCKSPLYLYLYLNSVQNFGM